MEQLLNCRHPMETFSTSEGSSRTRCKIGPLSASFHSRLDNVCIYMKLFFFSIMKNERINNKVNPVQLLQNSVLPCFFSSKNIFTSPLNNTHSAKQRSLCPLGMVRRRLKVLVARKVSEVDSLHDHFITTPAARHTSCLQAPSAAARLV